MSLFSKIFGSKDSAPAGPPPQELEVHFAYGSTNFQHLYALEDEIQHAIAAAAIGNYEGHDVSVDGSDGFFYLYGPDAEAIYRVISPVLCGCGFMNGATVTLWFGPRKWRTPKRVIQLPE